MSIVVNISAVAVGLILIGIVIKLVMEKRMTESQSVLWLLTGVAAIILGIFPNLLAHIASFLGIWYAPSVLLLFACVGLLLITFFHAIVISKNTEEIRELAIQVALLKEENKELKEKLAER